MVSEEELPAEQSSYLAVTTELEEEEAMAAEYSAALNSLEVGLGLSDEDNQEEAEPWGLAVHYQTMDDTEVSQVTTETGRL